MVILKSNSHADAVCAVREFMNPLLTGVFCKVGFFCKYLVAYEYIEVSNSDSAYNDPITGITCHFIFFLSLFFGKA